MRDAAKTKAPADLPTPAAFKQPRARQEGLRYETQRSQARRREGRVGSIDVSDDIFGIADIRADILQRMVKYQLAKRRAGTSKAKTPR